MDSGFPGNIPLRYRIKIQRWCMFKRILNAEATVQSAVHQEASVVSDCCKRWCFIFTWTWVFVWGLNNVHLFFFLVSSAAPHSDPFFNVKSLPILLVSCFDDHSNPQLCQQPPKGPRSPPEQCCNVVPGTHATRSPQWMLALYVPANRREAEVVYFTSCMLFRSRDKNHFRERIRWCFSLKYLVLLTQRWLQNVLTSPERCLEQSLPWTLAHIQAIWTCRRRFHTIWNVQILLICGFQKRTIPMFYSSNQSLQWWGAFKFSFK